MDRSLENPGCGGRIESLTSPATSVAGLEPVNSEVDSNSADSKQSAAVAFPDILEDENQLDEWLTRPRQILIDFVRTLPSPLLILGAGGKMGPTLAVLAKRAAIASGCSLDVVAVSRFTDEHSRRWLERHEISTIGADLLDRNAVAKLPDAANVIFLVGLKFGTSQNPAMTWAVNTIVPSQIAERYSEASLVALSTGNVYPMVSTSGAGAGEGHPLTPLGEYANSAIARERIFEYYSLKNNMPAALMRLNYAVELRYGVLADIAQKVRDGELIELSNGCFNCIWQGDANESVIRALALARSPAEAWNLTLPIVFRVRDVAGRFGELLGKTPRFSGCENDKSLLANSNKLWSAQGQPPTPVETILRWTAHWIGKGGRTLNKPTHFEVHNGQF